MFLYTSSLTCLPAPSSSFYLSSSSLLSSFFYLFVSASIHFRLLSLRSASSKSLLSSISPLQDPSLDSCGRTPPWRLRGLPPFHGYGLYFERFLQHYVSGEVVLLGPFIVYLLIDGVLVSIEAYYFLTLCRHWFPVIKPLCQLQQYSQTGVWSWAFGYYWPQRFLSKRMYSLIKELWTSVPSRYHHFIKCFVKKAVRMNSHKLSALLHVLLLIYTSFHENHEPWNEPPR